MRKGLLTIALLCSITLIFGQDSNSSKASAPEWYKEIRTVISKLKYANPDSALVLAKTLESRVNNDSDSLLWSRSAQTVAELLSIQEKYKEADFWFDVALKRNPKQSRGQYFNLNNQKARNFSKGLKYGFAIELTNKIISEIDDAEDSETFEKWEASAYYIQAEIFDRLNRHADGEPGLRKALIIFEKIGDKEGVGYTNRLIGGYYTSVNKPDSAFIYFERSFQMFQELGYKGSRLKAQINMGIMELELGQALHKTAMDRFEKVEVEARSSKLYDVLVSVLQAKADYYLLQNQNQSALREIEEAEKLYLEGKSKGYYQINFLFDKKTEILKKLGRFQEALKATEKQNQIKDSLNYVGEQISLDMLSARHQIELNNYRLESLETENAQNQRLLYRQRIGYIIIGIIGLLLSILLLQNRKKRKQLGIQKEQLQNQSKALQKANKIVQDSNLNLESKIDARTKELKNAYDKLQISERNARLSEFSVRSSDFAVFWLNAKGKFIRTNKACEALMGYDNKEFFNLTTDELYRNREDDDFLIYWDRVKEEKYFKWEQNLQRKDGSAIWVETFSHFIEFDGEDYICGFARDITQRKEAEKRLNMRSAYDQLLVRMSSGLINTNKSEIQDQISTSLQEAAEVFGADRAFLAEVHPSGEHYTIVNNWAREKAYSHDKERWTEVPVKDSSMFPLLQKKQTLKLNSINDLPEFAEREREMMRLEGIKSSLIVPNFSGNELVYISGMDTIKDERIWNEEEINLFRVFGEIAATAILKFKQDEEVANSENQLKLALDASGSAFWDWHVIKKEVYTSPQVKLITGVYYEAKPGSQEKWMDLVKPKYRENLKDNFRRAMHGELESFSVEYELTRADGLDVWVETVGKISERAPNGDVIRVTGTHQDISQRKAVENALLKSEERLKLALEAGKEAIWDWNLESQRNFVSEEFYGLMSFPRNVQMHKPEDWIARIHPEDAQPVAGEFSRLMKSTALEFERKYRVKNGKDKYIWTQTKGKVLRDADGKALRITGTLADISETVKYQLELDQLNTRLSALIENLPGLVYRCKADENWTMEFLSNSCKEVTGYEASELVNNKGISWKEITHPDDRELGEGAVRKKILEDNRFKSTYRIVTKGGEIRWCFEQGIAVRNKKNEIIAIEGYIADISDQIKAEERIIATILETEDKERRRIAKDLHDSLGQTLTAAALNFGAVKHHLSSLSEEARKKFEIAGELLKKAREESRNISHNVMPKDIDDFGFVLAVQSVIERMENVSSANFTFYHNLRESRLPNQVELNLFRITQEAINNALKYAQAHNITVQLMQYDDMIILTIDDDGKGFNLASLNETSTSLGISNMKNRANALSGEFSIDSRPDVGTNITVQIPVEIILYEHN